jgi:hypothetical protein
LPFALKIREDDDTEEGFVLVPKAPPDDADAQPSVVHVVEPDSGNGDDGVAVPAADDEEEAADRRERGVRETLSDLDVIATMSQQVPDEDPEDLEDPEAVPEAGAMGCAARAVGGHFSIAFCSSSHRRDVSGRVVSRAIE